MLGRQKIKTNEKQEVIKQKELIINKIIESKRESIAGIDDLYLIKEKTQLNLDQ